MNLIKAKLYGPSLIAKQVVAKYKRDGVIGVYRGVRDYCRLQVKKRSIKSINNHCKINTIEPYQYDFIQNYNPTIPSVFIPVPLEKNTKMVINWIVPNFLPGSGGHMTIFRMIHFLEKFGHTNKIYLFDGGTTGISYLDAKVAKKCIETHFISLRANVYIGENNIEESDVLCATSWQTAYILYKHHKTKQKFYFVQDYEPDFYPMSSERIFTEQTYKMGFKCITAGPWLFKKMSEVYGNKADFFWLAYDKKIYGPRTDIRRADDEIIFYGRYVTPRRGFELGIAALDIVKKKRPNVKIGIFGWELDKRRLPFAYKNYGVLTHKELAKLYARSTIGLVFSMTNYSLIPQEMMACGLPLVEYKGSNTNEILKDNETILLAEPNPYYVAEKILELIDNPEKRTNLTHNAQAWVSQFDWEKSARKVEQTFYEL